MREDEISDKIATKLAAMHSIKVSLFRISYS